MVENGIVPDYRNMPKTHILPPMTRREATSLKAEWRERSACAKLPIRAERENEVSQTDFTADYDRAAKNRAAKICGGCEVSDKCLASALISRDAHGTMGSFDFVMGGLSEDQREIIHKKYQGAKTRPIPTSH